MKKLLFIVVCCLCLCGCSNSEYQVSELILYSNHKTNYLKGTLKNISNDNCSEVQINVEFSSGSLKETGWVYTKSPDIDDILSFEEMFYGASGIVNIESYKVKVINIECHETKNN